jgi:hypothetical protein
MARFKVAPASPPATKRTSMPVSAVKASMTDRLTANESWVKT